MKIVPFILLLALSGFAQSTNPPSVNVYVFGSGTTNVPPDLTNAVAVAAGFDDAIALRAAGTVEALGLSVYGSSVPTGLSNVVAIAAGGYRDDVYLALKSDGTIVAWGPNIVAGFLPSGLSNVVAISAAISANVFLALRADGTVVGWGGGAAASVPPDLANVTALAAGGRVSLALKANGTVVGWGSGNSLDQVPPGLSNVTAIASFSPNGYSTTELALRADGSVVSWGQQPPINAPSDLTNALAIAAGPSYALAVKSDGTVVGWGNITVPPDLPYTLAITVGTRGPFALIDPAQGGSPPFITRQPAPSNQTVVVGSRASFSAISVGFGPLSYQWYFGTNAIPGAIGPVLTFTNLHEWQSGSYSIVVSNIAGFTTSHEAVLVVLPDLVGIDMVPRVAIQGEIGYSYNLQYIYPPAPTNAWQTVATVTITNQPQYYFDLSAIGQPARFYRLVQLP